ncbi:MAG: shikimate kinase [Sphaerochaetaceae bacterium]|jgi:shikimate kinase
MTKEQPNSVIYLVGIKHSGKSTIASIVSQILGYSHIDTDDLVLKEIEPEYSSIRKFYQTKGQDAFMDIEYRATKEYVTKERHRPLVIATGGGACDNPPLVEFMTQSGLIIYLYYNQEILEKRIFAGGIPPFLDTGDPHTSFTLLFNRRDELYRKFSSHMVSLYDYNSPFENGQLVASFLQKVITSEEPCLETALEHD